MSNVEADRYGYTIRTLGMRYHGLRNAIFTGLIHYFQQLGKNRKAILEMLDHAHNIGRDTCYDYHWSPQKRSPEERMTFISNGSFTKSDILREKSVLTASIRDRPKSSISRSSIRETYVQRIMLLLCKWADEFSINVRINQISEFLEKNAIVVVKPKKVYIAEFYPETGPAKKTVDIGAWGVYFFLVFSLQSHHPNDSQYSEWKKTSKALQYEHDHEWKHMIKEAEEKMFQAIEEETGYLPAFEKSRKKHQSTTNTDVQDGTKIDWDRVHRRTRVDPEFDWDKLDFDEWLRNNPEPQIKPKPVFEWDQMDWEDWMEQNPEPVSSTPVSSTPETASISAVTTTEADQIELDKEIAISLSFDDD